MQIWRDDCGRQLFEPPAENNRDNNSLRTLLIENPAGHGWRLENTFGHQ